MKKSKTRSGRKIDTWASKFNRFTNHPYTSITFTIFIYAVPAFLFTYLIETEFTNLVDSIFPKNVTDFIHEYQILLFTTCCILFLIERLWPIIDRNYIQPSIYMNDEGGLFLLESLNSVVKAKADRFSFEFTRLKQQNLLNDKTEVFSAITKPEQQIYCIINALWGFLDGITNDIEFQVRLVEIADSRPIQWVTFAPSDDPPTKEPEELNVPSSTLTNCIKKKKMVIVPDVAKEASKRIGQQYHMTRTDDCGSILCYPIYSNATKSWPYILSIKADKPNYFLEKRSDYYKWLLDQYTDRISFEHNLRLLKEES